MSFSSDVKNEIINQNEMTKKQRVARLLGMLCYGGRLICADSGMKLKFSTENPKIARMLYTLIKNDCEIKSKIFIHRGNKSIIYFVTVDDELEINDLFHTVGLLRRGEDLEDFQSFRINPFVVSDASERKAFLRGAFLAAGSVIQPQKNCHLELVTSHFNLARDTEAIFQSFDLNAKTAIRKSSCVIYFKSSAEIADILTILGAYDSLMEYHNIKIIKEMRNSVNRKMNCDTANLTKTLDASFKQVQAIEKLKKLGVLANLSEQLREIAELRLKYKELGLKELGEMLNPPLGKSGVNHRLRKLTDEADKYN